MSFPMLYAVKNSGEKIEISYSESADFCEYILPAKEFSDAEWIEVYSEKFDKRAGDEGFYLVPPSIHNSGGALIRFYARDGEKYITADHPVQRMIAFGDPDGTYAFRLGMEYESSVTARYLEGGGYTLRVKYSFSDQPQKEDLRITALRLPEGSDHIDAIKAVRDLKLKLCEIELLSEKRKERECVDYAARHPLVRIRMGWKPVPTEVLHQTKENEPPMHVACTFSDVRRLADRMKMIGVTGAEISLVGWNSKGHDGRWPDIFPVEEALGGEDELIKTVEHVKSLGYKITCHTNLADHYEISERFDEGRLAKKRDGSPRTHGNWAGGASFAACPKTQLEYAKEDLPRVSALGFEGIHYIDCLSIAAPDACFDSEHPISTKEAILCYREIMKIARECFGGFSSEGCNEYALGELDFSLYNCFRSYLLSVNNSSKPLCDEVIPVSEIMLHGIISYNQSSATVNFPIKGGDVTAMAMLFGSRPSLYVYSKFVNEDKKLFASLDNNWMGKEDLTLDTDSEITLTAEAIKRAEDHYRAYLPHLNSLVDDFKTLDSGLRVMRYEDGFTTVANFTDDDIMYGERCVAAHSYITIEG